MYGGKRVRKAAIDGAAARRAESRGSHPAPKNHKKTPGLFRPRVCLWCPEAESNHRHEDFQSTALPTELSGRACTLMCRRRVLNPLRLWESKIGRAHV